MQRPFLEVTYRKGQPLAAYLYLPRKEGDRSARTERREGGLVIDYTADGRAIGIELLTPSTVRVEAVNQALQQLGQPPLPADDLAPLLPKPAPAATTPQTGEH